MWLIAAGVVTTLGLGSSRDDLDGRLGWRQPVDLDLDLLGIAHLDHDSRVTSHMLKFVTKMSSCKRA